MIIKLIIEDFISPFAHVEVLAFSAFNANTLCPLSLNFTAFAPLCTVWFRSRVRSILIGLLMASIKRTARAILT